MTHGERITVQAQRLGADLLSALPSRWSHVRAVALRAEDLSADLDAEERDTVVAAAWLHDIGYADELAVTGFHAVDGARYLARLNWPSTVCGLVAFHTGARFEAAERGMPEELSQFEVPARHLLDTLTTADVSVGPDGARVDPTQRVAEILDRYDDADPVHRAVRRSAPGLLAAVDRTVRRLALAGIVEGQPM